MVRGVIFDVDGTLVDSVDMHTEAWQRIFAQWGYEVPFAAIRAQIGKGGDELMPEFLPKDVVARDGKAIEAERSALFKAEYLDRVQGFPGVADLVRALMERGVRVALGSSGKREEVEHHMRVLGIDGMGVLVATSEDAEKSKPHPDIFQAAVGKLELPAGEVAAVGDTPYDAQAAVRAGVVPMGVLCGGVPEDVLRGAGCVAVFRDPVDMLGRVGAGLLSPPHPAVR